MKGDCHNKRKYCAICQRQFYKVLYKFPKNSELREKWVRETGLNPKGAYIDTRICHIHFDDLAWRRQQSNGKTLRTLKEDAVPTLFVGENAPVPDPDCAIPHLSYTSGKTVRCAVCACQCRRLDALPIFDKHDYYTEFGVALAVILKITSRVVSSRYSCRKCSRAVISCYKAIVDINVSTLMTTRSRQRPREEPASFEQPSIDGSDDDDLALTEVAGRMKAGTSCGKIKTAWGKTDQLKEQCIKCEMVFGNVDAFTEHFIQHVFRENREVFRRSVATTQVDEVEIEMASNDFELEIVNEKEAQDTDKKSREPRETKKTVLADLVESDGEKEETSKDWLDATEQPKNPQLPEVKLEAGIKEEDTDDRDYEPDLEEHISSADEAVADEKNDGDSRPRKCRVDTDSDSRSSKVRKRKRRTQSFEGGVQLVKKRMWKEPDIPGPRVCYLCGMTLKSHRTYITHMERHKNPEKFNKTCHLCGKRRVNIAQHVRLCRKDKAREAKERDYPDRKLPSVTCNVCNKKVCEMYLKRHLRAHEIDDDVARNGSVALEKYLQTCSLCGRRVKHLSSHMVQHQKKGDIPKTEIQSTFDCDHCGATFNQRTLMVNHMVLKHGADPKRRLVRGVRTKWTCSVCKQEFLSYNLIRKHTLAEHNGVGCDLQCEVCGKKYNARTSYIFHINSQHLDYFKHRCKQCGQYFVEEVSYKDHCLFRCPAVTGGRRKRSSANRVASQPRPKPKLDLEMIRTEERHLEQPSMPHYNNIYGSYEAVYSMNHRYLQF